MILNKNTYRISVTFILVVLVSIFIETKAQNGTQDSLENRLESYHLRDTTRVNLLNELAYNLRRSNLDRSCQCAAEAKNLAEELNYKKGVAGAMNALGNCFYLRANYAEAFAFFGRAEKLNLEIDSRSGLTFSLNGTGMTHLRQGNYPIALDYIQKALVIAEEIGDETRVSFSTYNVGNCYFQLGEYSLALDYYERSLELSRELGKQDFLAVTLRDMGQTHTKLNNFEEALKCFQNSIQIMEREGDQKGMAFTMVTLGILYKKQNEVDRAFDYFQQAARLSEENGFKHHLCNSYTCLGEVYLERENYSQAMRYAHSSLLIAKELNILPEQRDAYHQLSKIYEATNDYKKAFQSHKAFKELNDSIFNEESVRSVANLKNSYDYEREKQKAALIQQQKDAVQQAEARWQQTILNFFIGAFILMTVMVLIVFKISRQRKKANAILSSQKNEIEIKSRRVHAQNSEIQRKNRELATQREQLEETLEELQKTQSQLVQSEKMASVGVLTAGIAHEINNPLNFIHGGKSALEKYTKKNLREHEGKMKPLLDTIDLGIKRVTGIVLSLNRFSRQGNGKNETCDIHLIIDNCLQILEHQIKSKVDIEKNYTSDRLDLEGQEGELHQVILNVLANAAQAIRENGTITITTRKVREKLEVVISDTGCGISKENLGKVTNPFFTTKDPGQGTGLGMSIAYNIIQSHQGTIKYESDEGVGTTVTIGLPISVVPMEA